MTTRTSLVSCLFTLALVAGCEAEPGSDGAVVDTGTDAHLPAEGVDTPRRGYVLEGSIWTTRSIPVCWENPSRANGSARALVERAVRETWSAAADVRFVGWGVCTWNSLGVRIVWSDENPRVVALGSALNGVPSGMILNDTFEKWGTDCQGDEADCIYDIAVHEFGHALGISHEQNRPDTPDDKEICDDAPQGTDGDWMIGEWDLDSVMNYCNPEWNNDGVLSTTDILTVQRMYGPRYPHHMDFNNDGFGDLVVGVPYEHIGSTKDAGSIGVLYGDAAGLDGAGDQAFHQDTSGVQGVAEHFDRFGQAVAAGDFDGDDAYDIAIGVPGEDVGSIESAGAVNVLYGTDNKITTSGDQIWVEDDLGIGAASIAYDAMGQALAAGDFDGDGYDDLAIGAPGAPAVGWGTWQAAGAVYVLRGSPGGLKASPIAEVWSASTPGVPGDGPESYARFGSALATADLNGDGYADLAIGAKDQDAGGDTNAGSVVVLYGGPGGLGVVGAQYLHQDSPGVSGVTEAYDAFGSSLAAGDLDFDGYDDLVVGVEGEDIGSVSNAGMVHVFFGASSGLGAATGIHQDSTGISSAPETNDKFGHAVGVGDVDRDGYGDLVVGVPGESINGQGSAGAVHVIFGSAAGINAAGSEFWHQDVSGITGTSEAADQFGWSLGVQDFDGDGFSDLAVGIIGEEVDGNSGHGAIHVMYGSSGGLSTTGDVQLHQDSSGIEGVNEADDRWGYAMP